MLKMRAAGVHSAAMAVTPQTARPAPPPVPRPPQLPPSMVVPSATSTSDRVEGGMCALVQTKSEKRE